ncbi:MAG: hypothetical protein WC996_08240 [Peptostreptococcales bacterium]
MAIEEGMKEYYGFVSFSGRIAFNIEAENEEQAKDIIFNDIGSMSIDVSPESPLKIDFIDWQTIDQQARGNVSEAFIGDFEIYREGG